MSLRSFASCALAAAGLILLAPSQAQSAKPPVEAFGTPLDLGVPVLSPDGKHLALIQAYNGRPLAVIMTLDPAGTKPMGLPISDGFIVRVMWVNNTRLMITINVNRRYFGDDVNPWYRTITVDAQGKNMAVMFSGNSARNVNYSTAHVQDLAPDDPDHVYMPMIDNANEAKLRNYSGVAYRNILFRVDVNDGEAERVAVGGPNTKTWITDGNGKPVGRIDQTLNPATDHLLLYTDKGLQEAEKEYAVGTSGIGVSGLTEDGSALVLWEHGSEGTVGLVARSLADGSKTALFFDPGYDIDGALKDPWTGRVLGVSVTADQAKDTYFDPELQGLQQGLELAFPGNSVHAVSWDRSRKKVVIAVDGPHLPRSYYLLDRDTHNASLLMQTYPGLKETDLSSVKPYPYKARDGLDIPAYLTMPRGKPEKNLPLVVMPHGGPMARDAMGFDWMAQFLANRGYAVLQPNFRGSSGYGRKFEAAGYGQWGLKMQDDVTDGVKRLIADGIADPKRICIVGASYGGYAALAGAAFTPDLYACSVSIAGVSDLREFLATRKHDYGRDSNMIESWSLFIGDRSDDTGKLDAASPVKHAGKVQCPVLLIHGAADSTVRVDQSEMVEEALKQAGKKVAFIKIENENHYLLSSKSRVKVLTELETFLKANIGE